MTFLRTLRSLQGALLALFLVAQLAGVIPLIYDHTLNIYEAIPVAAHGHPHLTPTAANPDADHHHGALNLHDQCCTLHMLAGPLPYAISAVPVAFRSARIMPDELPTLTGANPGVLDHPPRPAPLS